MTTITPALANMLRDLNNPGSDFTNSQIKRVIYFVVLCVFICSATLLCLITESYLLRSEKLIEIGRLSYVALFSSGGTLLILLCFNVMCAGNNRFSKQIPMENDDIALITKKKEGNTSEKNEYVDIDEFQTVSLQ